MKSIVRIVIRSFLFGIVIVSEAQTYQYDHSGRLIADATEEIADIEWNNQGKIVKLTRVAGSTKPDLEFAYDAGGNRMIKIVKPRTAGGIEPAHTWRYTYYSYDASGSLIAILEKKYESLGDKEYVSALDMVSNPILFADRIGMLEERRAISRHMFTASIGADGNFTNVEPQGTLVPPLNNMIPREAHRGVRQYELTNHLLDVTVVVNDRKIISEEVTASVRQATDYYAFGMTMPARGMREGANYRYGFGGAERDDEVRVQDGSYEFPGRSIYDARLARFVSVDPMWRAAPSVSPYAYGLNSPLFFSDKSGEQATVYQQWVQLMNMSQKMKNFGQKIKDERLDAFKTKSFIDENTSNERAFMYGVIDQAIEELKVLDPVTWGESAMGLYELANGIATGDISADDAYNAIVSSVEGMKDYLKASTDSGDKDFYYNNGRNAVAAISVIVAITKIRTVVKGAKEMVRRTGCFVGDTEILTAGNKFVHIKDISTEEEIYHLSEEEIRILEEEREALEYVVEITVDDIEFIVLEDQLFIVNDQWKRAIDLTPGDKLLKLDGTTVEVQRITKVKKNDMLLEASVQPSKE